MVKIPVEVKCLGEMCKGCKQMEIDMEGVHFLPDGIRGMPTFDPHCKHMDICRNALELNKQTVTEREKGHWKIDEYNIYHCPFCNAINTSVYVNFCASCGADLRGEQ